MIEVTRIRGGSFLLNPELVETVEANPDTVITLVNGKKFVVAETPTQVAERVVEYRRRVGPFPLPSVTRPEET